MTVLTALVQNHQTNIDCLKQLQSREETTGLLRALQTVTNDESDKDEIEPAPRKIKKEKRAQSTINLLSQPLSPSGQAASRANHDCLQKKKIRTS